MVRVKFCGMMRAEDMAMAEAAGADALGFVTEYPVPVPWNLTVREAAALVKRAPAFLTTVAVVGGSPEDMVRTALAVRPKVLQLHGDETLEEIRMVLRELRETGIRVIKAMRVDADTGLARFSVRDPREAAVLLAGSGLSALAVDSRTSSMPAGTGVPLDWDMAASIAAHTELPFILAGGLNADNVCEAVAVVRPWAVDVITGVEDEPGRKSLEKMRAFVMAAKGIKLDPEPRPGASSVDRETRNRFSRNQKPGTGNPL